MRLEGSASHPGCPDLGLVSVYVFSLTHSILGTEPGRGTDFRILARSDGKIKLNHLVHESQVKSGRFGRKKIILTTVAN